MKKSELIAAAKDLNTVLGLEPAIDVTQDVAQIKALVKQAGGLVEPTDKLNPVTTRVLAELGIGEPAPAAPKAKAAPKAAPKASAAPKAKAAPVEAEEVEEEEIIIDEDDAEPAPKAKPKAKAAAAPKAKAAPKAPAMTRLTAAVAAVQSLAMDAPVTVGRIIDEADAIYGTPNLKEANQMTRQALTVLKAWGAIEVENDTVTVL